MVIVADPNDAHRDHRSPDPTSAPETPRAPEVVDAEVVEDAPQSQPSGSAQSQDDEAFRQYQQFLEFQKFQEWQRQQGDPPGQGPQSQGTPSGTEYFVATTTTGAPWWKRLLRLLRFKFVRRVLYVLLALLLIPLAIDHWFSSGERDSSAPIGTPGNQDPGLSPAAPTVPQDIISNVHNMLAYAPGPTCGLFTESGAKAFAAAHQAPDCVAAAEKLHSQVTVPTRYAVPGISEDTIEIADDDARASSCTLTVEGGPRLGTFGLHRQPNGGWLIDSYLPEAC